MKAPKGGFDLRSADDGIPAANVRSGRGATVIIACAVVGAGTFLLGGWAGGISVARNNFNTANSAARSVKSEIEGMQKTLKDIGAVIADNSKRLSKDPLVYDAQTITNLERIKLDPRPNTAKIFRVDYFRLPDADVDKLFNYYYDTIALYGEIERHIKKSKADAASLQAFAEKSAGTANKNYGVVFDNSGGKIIVANLVEIGDQVCKGSTKEKPIKECGANDLTGFQVRWNTGANWSEKKIGKLDVGNVVPMKPTPLMDAVMSGSPDQVRQESYKQRWANIRSLWSRTTTNQKELLEGIKKDADRPDIWTVF